MKYAFIQRQTQWSVKALCAVLQVSRSGYYDWIKRPPSQQVMADQMLLKHLHAVHNQYRQAYGAVKTWKHLNRIGIVCGKHRVARLRREAGIEAQRKRRFRLTVEHHHTPPAAPDLLQRQFSATSPNRTWVGDMTFIRTRQGWLHLAVLMDLFSRKVVGWAFGSKANTALHQQRSAWPLPNVSHQPGSSIIPTEDRSIVLRLIVSSLAKRG